ncbi:MAG: hypothetical protein NVS3B1_30270 [Marmoricola sp.]
MKYSDVQVGETYAYSRWLNKPGEAYRPHQVTKFVAKGIEDATKRSDSGWRGTRKTKVIVGTLYRTEGAPIAFKTEARHLVATWVDMEALAKREAENEAKWAAAAQERAEQFTPMLDKIVARIQAETGIDVGSSGYQREAEIRTGRVEIPIDVLYRTLFGS